MYSSQDKAVMLGLLGWSRGGKEKHLPLDMIREIGKFLFFDSRTEEYEDHMELKNTRLSLQYDVLEPMMKMLNKHLVVHQYGVYKVQYSPIIVSSNCCSSCGEFMDKDIACDRTKCKCVWYSEEDLEQMEYENNEYYEEDLAEQMKKNESESESESESEHTMYYDYDDLYDNEPEYDESYESEESDYDYDNHEYTHIEYEYEYDC